MSINCELDRGNKPILAQGEYLLVKRKDIRLISNIGDFNVKSTGQLYLTTIRLIFVADSPSSDFKSLDVPLLLIRDEKFNMPIFGCNNLSFVVVPQNTWGYGSQFSCKLEFRSGGAQTFLRIFWKVMSGVNEVRECHDRNSIPSHVQDIASGSFVSQIYVDPTDPSYVYTTQPCQPTAALPVNYPVPMYYTIPQAVPVQPVQPAQPTYVQPVQPTYVQPVQPVQPVYVQPSPQTGYPQPSPQTGYPQPSPQTGYPQPSPQTGYPQPTYATQPVYTAQPVYTTQPTYVTQPGYQQNPYQQSPVSQPTYTPPSQNAKH